MASYKEEIGLKFVRKLEMGRFADISGKWDVGVIELVLMWMDCSSI